MTAADAIAGCRRDPLQEEWLFTGRHAILARILAWIHTEEPGALVVTGSAGSGKSAVVDRIVALSQPARRQMLLEHAPLEPGDPDPLMGAVNVAVHLRGMAALDLAIVLADQLRLPRPENCWQLVEAMATMPYPPVLVIDGLDEALPEQAIEIVTDLLVPLSVLASVLIATQHQEFGWQPPPGEAPAVQLAGLFGGHASIIDLDGAADTTQDIERYLTRRLTAADRADLAARVAPALASKATAQPGGFLYARTVVSQIVRGIIDVDAPDWEQQLAPTTIAALEHDLSSTIRVRDGMALPDAARDLLRALAWGMGRGFPARGLWEAAATALSPDGVEYRPADLEWVLERLGCYIVADNSALPTGSTESAGEPAGEVTYRLVHRTFAEYLVGSSPDVAGRPAGQALAEGLVAFARQETGSDAAIDTGRPYLRRHLPRHAVHGGPVGIAALRRLAEADPGFSLAEVAVALDSFATHLFSVGNHAAGLNATQHEVEIYRSLVDTDPSRYLPGLAAALGALAVAHAKLKEHELALIPAQEAAEICRRLTETSVEIYFTRLVVALRNLTRYLAVLDRISAAVDVYTSCIETFAAAPTARDALIIERAEFHINHGDASTGIRELITLLTLDDGQTPDPVLLAARNFLRAHHSQDPVAVNRVWQSVTGTAPPDWLAITATQIGLVTEWITAPNWVESRDFFVAHAGELLEDSASVVLDELALVTTARVELHRHVLDGVRELGLEAAYRPLLLRDLLADWMKLSDWQDSRSFAEEHATDLLTVEAEIALIHFGNPVGTLVHVALLRLARREGFPVAYACVTDRQMAADRMRQALTDVEPDPIAELAALEGQVFGERFNAAAHLAVAASLMGEEVIDPTRLEELAEQADPVDRQRVADEIADLIRRFPDRAELFGALPEILLSPDVLSGGDVG